MANEFMFKHLDEAEAEVTKLFIEAELKAIKIASMSRGQWLDYLSQKFYPSAAKPAPKAAGYRHRPPLPTPLRNKPQAPYEVKNLNLKQKGEPGYEAEQRRLDALWRAERRAKGYPE